MPAFTLGYKAVSYILAAPITATLTGTDSTDEAAINAAVATALATAAVVTGITGEVTLDLTTDDSTLTTRETAARGFKSYILGLSDGSVKLSMVFNTGDANFLIMRNAWRTKSEIFFADLALPFATAGTEGLAGNFLVKDFSKKEPVESGPQTVDITLLPSSFTHWYVKASS